MKEDFLIESFGERLICIRGVGKLFYQDGFPISISISELNKKGIEVSIFHVADECLKNGWSSKTTFNKLKADSEDYIENDIVLVSDKYNLELLERFCYAEYEVQREMIHQYLFNGNVDEINKTLKNKLR